MLPVTSPVRPMLAKAVTKVPRADGLLYEPKWDGFRCVLFRDGSELALESRNNRPLLPYFPELAGPLRAALPPRCVVDGELVIATEDGLYFDGLQARIHPAVSRIEKLAVETPATYIAFDLLALGDRDLRTEPFATRRALLEEVVLRQDARLLVTPMTADPELAEDWFRRFEGAGFDGVIAKRPDGEYREGERVMWKVKPQRTADCVVAGFRWHKDGAGVGSLLLGLNDGAGTLHHVGVASAFSAKLRGELVAEVAPLQEGALDAHPWRHWDDQEAQAAAGGGVGARMPGAPSRWNGAKDLTWEPLRPERVVEVRYEHVLDGRFRHPARFLRWRDDKDPGECTYEQLETVPPMEYREVFG